MDNNRAPGQHQWRSTMGSRTHTSEKPNIHRTSPHRNYLYNPNEEPRTNRGIWWTLQTSTSLARWGCIQDQRWGIYRTKADDEEDTKAYLQKWQYKQYDYQNSAIKQYIPIQGWDTEGTAHDGDRVTQLGQARREYQQGKEVRVQKKQAYKLAQT